MKVMIASNLAMVTNSMLVSSCPIGSLATKSQLLMDKNQQQN